jgi:uncharacterized Fe-S center protein
MKKKSCFLGGIILIVTAFSITGCAQKVVAQGLPGTGSIPSGTPGATKVYMTTDISPAGLAAVYNALGRRASGKVAVKISTGEPGGRNFLQPALIGDFVKAVNGTIVESNTAYGGRRASTVMHYQVARDHGFTAIAPVVILDENGDVGLPVSGGNAPQGRLCRRSFQGL